ncbi:Tetratricopeptide repeat protein [Caballeronia hypogeia]|uniref:Tetratricopeptide repeat protein n=1 Tax=Caballeronia hypogeia TaxID=1777140 RepID=A0A157ZHA9_9BURK|nr:VWA domain-containing protein [Caballeronia hypogeia]SAK44875.1 Tetratricopeptide repeat protein [Caballeronia hypogeia]
MAIDLTAFHFLRPLWLLLLIPAVLLPFVWLRRNDVRARWRNLIAPRLLEHLIVGDGARRGVQPVHTLAALIALGAIAIAGPTWQQERPPFDQDKAPLVVVLELARSMDAADIAPTRIERAKQKVLDLAAARKGARTGLVVFAASAHLVVPPTEDPAMLDLYVPALAPELMPRDGKNAAAGLEIAERMLEKDEAAGTIVFVSDGFDESHADEFLRVAKASKHQLLWLAVGTENGGPIRKPNGELAMDDAGHPLTGTFDAAAIQKITRAASIPLASMRADDDDIEWVRHRAQVYLEAEQESKVVPRWKETGYWLILPILLIALYCFRRGWTVKWLPVLIIALAASGTPKEAHAASFEWLDLFATHDQQGRFSFEHGDYKRAAQRFDDPMWKGRAQYLAGDYADALETFSRLDTADAYFYIGNTLAHLKDYEGAVKAYDNAIARRANFTDALANRDLARKLIKDENEGDESTTLKPDQIDIEKKKGKEGKQVLVQGQRPSEDAWMRNLNTSPAAFLHQRFAQEAEGAP